MTNERKLHLRFSAKDREKFDRCPDCDCRKAPRLTQDGWAVTCLDCEENPPWVSALTPIERMRLMGAVRP